MSKSRKAGDASSGREALSSRGRGGLRSTVAALVLLALAALAAYHNSFSGPFIFDDPPSIVDNPDIRHLATTLREDPQINEGTGVGRRRCASRNLSHVSTKLRQTQSPWLTSGRFVSGLQRSRECPSCTSGCNTFVAQERDRAADDRKDAAELCIDHLT